ncbi:GTP pyrophosphokinase [Galdieria sulphuraria]|nr:GTP pyrophosphokinase [Galdieria sulphuraria]
MKRGRKLKEIYDLIALRIIIKPRNPMKEVQACYSVLTIVEQRWCPVAYRNKDFIKYPKLNGYRALHTTVILNKIPFEVQIRSEEMHYHAEYGNSAHFLYKLSQSSDSDQGV